MARKLRQVIVGNGAAGLSAIKTIREARRPCNIILVSSENCDAYSPVMMTHCLSGEISKDQMFIADSHFYEENDVERLFGDKAIGLDPSKQMVYLESGRQVAYDNLLIATGASPKSLEVESIEANNILSLRTMWDMERISELTKIAKESIVIGGGLVSLQVADALYKRGFKLTLLVSSGQILSRNLNADSAGIIQQEMESRGVSIFCGINVRGVKRGGEKVIITSDSGQEFVGDMVVVGKGVDPNIGWLRNSGIRVNRGVLVDEFMRATFGNIFAAGDVTEVRNIITGQREVLPSWSAACVQGRIVGLNMVGQLENYPGGLMENITTLFGLPLAAIGLTRATNDYSSEEIGFSDHQQRIYRKILLAQNRIVGAILLGITEDAGVIRNLIRKKVDVSPWKEEIARTPLNLRGVFVNQLPRFWKLY